MIYPNANPPRRDPFGKGFLWSGMGPLGRDSFGTNFNWIHIQHLSTPVPPEAV